MNHSLIAPSNHGCPDWLDRCTGFDRRWRGRNFMFTIVENNTNRLYLSKALAPIVLLKKLPVHNLKLATRHWKRDIAVVFSSRSIAKDFQNILARRNQRSPAVVSGKRQSLHLLHACEVSMRLYCYSHSTMIICKTDVVSMAITERARYLAGCYRICNETSDSVQNKWRKRKDLRTSLQVHTTRYYGQA